MTRKVTEKRKNKVDSLSQSISWFREASVIDSNKKLSTGGNKEDVLVGGSISVMKHQDQK